MRNWTIEELYGLWIDRGYTKKEAQAMAEKDYNEMHRKKSDIEKHHNDSMLKSGDDVIYGGKRSIYIGRSDSTPDGEEKIVLFSPDIGFKIFRS